jgi:hypothetical protein
LIIDGSWRSIASAFFNKPVQHPAHRILARAISASLKPFATFSAIFFIVLIAYFEKC